MDAIFHNRIASGDVIIYMDDILITTNGSLEHYKAKVAHILQKLKNDDLFLKLEKCQFHKDEVEYLGVIIGKGQVKMDPVKVQGITDWPVPTNLHKLRSFLDFGNYYKDFIPDYSFITHPLHDLTRKNVPYNWNNTQQAAFKLLKWIFISYPVLHNADPNKRYILDIDTFNFSVGATLSQDYSNGRHPIGLFSKSLFLAEQNHNFYDQELLTIIYGIQAFIYLLLEAQQKFQIHCNHQNLKYFKSPQKITLHQVQWNKFLQDYNFELVHFPGKSNTIADLFSWRKNFEGGVNPNESITLLSEHLFNKKDQKFACTLYPQMVKQKQDPFLVCKISWIFMGMCSSSYNLLMQLCLYDCT